MESEITRIFIITLKGPYLLLTSSIFQDPNQPPLTFKLPLATGGYSKNEFWFVKTHEHGLIYKEVPAK